MVISLTCGLRLSEVLALRWEDYRDGSISVTKSLRKDRQETKPPKNNDFRTVACPSVVEPLLMRWKAAQQVLFSETGLEWSEESPIVSSRIGNCVLQRSMTRWFDQARKDYPIPDDFTFHELRHTYVTLLNRDKETDSRTAQEMTGHRNPQSFSTYTHTTDEWQRIAAENIGSVLLPASDEPLCRNCRLWTPSPVSRSRGACWAGPTARPIETDADSRCANGRFEPKAA